MTQNKISPAMNTHQIKISHNRTLPRLIMQPWKCRINALYTIINGYSEMPATLDTLLLPICGTKCGTFRFQVWKRPCFQGFSAQTLECREPYWSYFARQQIT